VAPGATCGTIRGALKRSWASGLVRHVDLDVDSPCCYPSVTAGGLWLIEWSAGGQRQSDGTRKSVRPFDLPDFQKHDAGVTIEVPAR
jgi:hypothetical protein